MPAGLAQLANEARQGGPRAVRAAGRLMSQAVDDPARLPELLALDPEAALPRMTVGVTGAPGAGKSSLVDRLAAEFRRRRPDSRLGIIAVDPSSPFTGGALLGDRVRMMRHAVDPGVFIRSLATRGQLGGLTLGVAGVVRVMGLIGCETVIIETVGVGQSEIDVARYADRTMVVLAPGQGDSIQLLKAGLMEAGDLFVVNKADRDDAPLLHQRLLETLARRLAIAADVAVAEDDVAAEGVEDHDARHLPQASCHPPQGVEAHAGSAVVLCSSVSGQGFVEVADWLDRQAEMYADQWRQRRRQRRRDEVRAALLAAAGERLAALCDQLSEGRAWVDAVLAGRPLGAVVDELLAAAAEAKTQACGEANADSFAPGGNGCRASPQDSHRSAAQE